MTSITAEGRTYPAYVATSHGTGLHPALVLVHSFNELEPGYRIVCDDIAGDGFVVIAPNGRPTASSPGTRSGPSSGRPSRSLGTGAISIPPDSALPGSAPGGRYTMLFLPRMHEFGADVAFYGFPFNAGSANGTAPAAHIAELESPMLMIHGSRDQASNITNIYNYTRQLDSADRYFELKIYQGKPTRVHGPERHPCPG